LKEIRIRKGLDETEPEGKLIGDIVGDAKAILCINIATKWGLTNRNLKELVQIDNQYRDQGLKILAFPSNSFN